MSRSDARQVKSKSHKFNVNLVTACNPIIKKNFIRNNLPLLYIDPEMKNMSPEGTINVTYKKGKSLREIISPSMFPQTQVQSHSKLSKCKSRRCDVCQNVHSYWQNI